MRWRTRSLGMLVVAAGLSACSLLTSFDTLTGGAEGAPEAGADGSPAEASTGGDAGVGESGGNDSGVDAAAVLDCADAGVFLCEDFEQVPLDVQKWSIRTEYQGTVTLDPTRPHRGKTSLHAHVDTNVTGGGNIAQIGHVGVYPDEYFVRAYFFQPSPVTLGGHDYISLRHDQLDGPSLDLNDNSGFLDFTSRTPDYTDVPTATAFPLDKWVCVELHVKNGIPGDGGVGTGHLQVFQNDTELTDMNVDLPTFPITVAVFGSADSMINDLWIDDIIVDTKRIGCAE